MYPILFSIGRVHIYNHGLLMVLGALIGGLVVFRLAKSKNYKTDFLFDLFIYSFVAGLIGARFLYVILYFNQFASVKEMFFVWYGGLVSYGGMLGGALLAYLILKTRKENIYKWFDIGIIGVLLGWAIGRIGCLLNGDSYGVLSSSKIAIWGRIPTQLFESIGSLIVAIIIYFLLKNKGRLKLADGVLFWLGLAGYTIVRFLVDFFRDEAIFAWHLKAGQLGSLIILVISSIMIYRLVKARKEIAWS